MSKRIEVLEVSQQVAGEKIKRGKQTGTKITFPDGTVIINFDQAPSKRLTIDRTRSALERATPLVTRHLRRTGS